MTPHDQHEPVRLHDAIAAAMRRRQLNTVGDFADASGLSRNEIYALLRPDATPSPQTVQTLSTALDLSVLEVRALLTRPPHLQVEPHVHPGLQAAYDTHVGVDTVEMFAARHQLSPLMVALALEGRVVTLTVGDVTQIAAALGFALIPFLQQIEAGTQGPGEGARP
ncbi:helix-turn-helix transcriptional regulator [Deinococcus sp. HMF7604]|uniref:helix-turn-helix domain-containing protein n=1 Tax=Deinococcus betulae TaxID=2873312 RepID=UPI001CCDA025|nr:helix-turn-helix transcriptional regulator [Deinococcus betulae]MBZ9751723.1 helix-turn-helix transcriptional regulator [Deinococcus betulae]